MCNTLVISSLYNALIVHAEEISTRMVAKNAHFKVTKLHQQALIELGRDFVFLFYEHLLCHMDCLFAPLNPSSRAKNIQEDIVFDKGASTHN